MARGLLTHLAALLTVGWVWGATYKVTTNADAGVGSLRWAIGQANNHAGADEITFAATLSNQHIVPQSALPAIADPKTYVRGDTDGDGLPNIALVGTQAGPVDGLRVEADNCLVEGLAVMRFKGNGIVLSRASFCRVDACHVGVDRPGMKAAPNGLHQLKLWRSRVNYIGWGDGGVSNVIAAGAANGMRSGIYVANSSGNHLRYNHIGVARDGQTPLQSPQETGVGVTLITPVLTLPSGRPAEGPREAPETAMNALGDEEGGHNVIGGVQVGIEIRRARLTSVWHSYVGVARDGVTPLPVARRAVVIRDRSYQNRIGPGCVLSGTQGVVITGAGTVGNTVEGNHIGWNAPGTDTLPMAIGVACWTGAGAQTIKGNTFGGEWEDFYTTGVQLSRAGGGSTINANTLLESAHHGMEVTGVGGSITANYFTRNQIGLFCLDVPHELKVRQNSFSGCDTAVHLEDDSQPDLGAGTSPYNAGLNRFYFSNRWYIYNHTANYIPAEGNRFPGGLLDPHVKIWDRRDELARGWVDIYPVGPSLPGLSSTGPLAVSGATAAPAAAGAEISFALSAPASVSVSVLNLAGRPVATVCRARECEAGTNRLLWNACADNGLRVPGGRYVIEVRAQSPDGAATRALTAVLIER